MENELAYSNVTTATTQQQNAIPPVVTIMMAKEQKDLSPAKGIAHPQGAEKGCQRQEKCPQENKDREKKKTLIHIMMRSKHARTFLLEGVL